MSTSTEDIAERLLFIGPGQIELVNYPKIEIRAVFNPGMIREDDKIIVYPRIVLGYYSYASVIGKFEVGLEELLKRKVREKYEVEIILKTDSYWDFWGCEDPRVQKLSPGYYMVYTGRYLGYFDDRVTYPTIAYSKDGRVWKKIGVFVWEEVNNKDCILIEVDDKVFVLNRVSVPQLHLFDKLKLIFEREKKRKKLSMWIGEVDKKELDPASSNKRIYIKNNRLVLKPRDGEVKVGWGAPAIQLDEDVWLAICHTVNEDLVYRIFAVLLEYRNNTLEITGITKKYIMEPKEIPEICGDRPNVIYPCGCIKINKKDIIISYGSADSCIGFAKMNIDEILSLF